MVNKQDLINDLATALVHHVEIDEIGKKVRYQAGMLPEQIAVQLAALAANGNNYDKERTNRILEVPIKAYEDARAEVYRICRLLGWKGSTPKHKYNPSRRCDSRCWNAVGPDCSCSCNGTNHGSGSDFNQSVLS